MNAKAPPQTPEAKQELATRQSSVPATIGGDIQTLAVAGRDDVERVEASVTIPPDYQYAISRWNSATRQKELKVGLTADAYDYINRALGASFYMPSWVHDEAGERQRNPIHRKDYIYLRLAIVYYNPLGQLVLSTEDVEVDFQMLWMETRAKAESAQVLVDEAGLPMFDDMGNPALKLDPKDELKAIRELTRNRAFGPRYAITVARVRLLKQATGIRSLPIEAPRPFTLKIVGFRDRMTPQERIAAAGGDVQAMFDREADIEPLRGAEAAEVAADVEAASESDAAVEATERDSVQAAQESDDLPPGVDAAVDQVVEQQRSGAKVTSEDREAVEGEQSSAPWAD